MYVQCKRHINAFHLIPSNHRNSIKMIPIFLHNLQHEPHIDKDFNFGAGATFALSTCLESQFGKNMSLSNVWVYGIYD